MAAAAAAADVSGTGGADSSLRPRRSPCRDLNLSYALADANSPDLPIFGRTAATPLAATPAGPTSWQQQQQQQRQPQLQTPLAQQQGDEDSTGELYSSLIHSNMQGLGRRGAEESTPDTEGEAQIQGGGPLEQL